MVKDFHSYVDSTGHETYQHQSSTPSAPLTVKWLIGNLQSSTLDTAYLIPKNVKDKPKAISIVEVSHYHIVS